MKPGLKGKVFSRAMLDGDHFADFHSWGAWTMIGGAFGCVVCAALAAGLTVGLMSLDPLELEIKRRVGTAKEKAMAAKVCPIINRHHLLLVTLLLFNSLANETLPLFLDRLVPSYLAVILSVTVVLVFGEIIPSALFSGPNQLRIASRLSGFVYALMALFLPISAPIAWLLDRTLGNHGLKRYTREELSMLVELQREVGHRRREHTRAANLEISEHAIAHKPISRDEATIVAGVLMCHHKRVRHVMKPLAEVYMLSMEDILDEEKLCEMVACGFSRVPVHSKRGREDIRGFLLVKRLIVIDPEDRRPVHTLPLRLPIVVSPNDSLLELINVFQEGRSHLALVSNTPELTKKALASGDVHSGKGAPIGIITLEDVFEEILQEEIYDEADQQEKNALASLRRIRKKARLALSKTAGRGRPATTTLTTSTAEEKSRLLYINGDDPAHATHGPGYQTLHPAGHDDVPV